ncbi:hypothetical protein A4G19_07080 [Pasteurellaceae bacterium Macca]|nr:hypothetical protein [Pasteurellaceae bacterium Macca]
MISCICLFIAFATIFIRKEQWDRSLDRLSLYSAIFLLLVQGYFWFKISNSYQYLTITKEYRDIIDSFILFITFQFILPILVLLFSLYIKHRENDERGVMYYIIMAGSFQIALIMTASNFEILTALSKIVFNFLYLVVPGYVLLDLSLKNSFLNKEKNQ